MINTIVSMINPVGFKLMFMLCLMMQAVFGEQEIMCIQREREALLKFKASLVDRYGMLSSWTTADCCQWKGIRCSNLTRHVLMLDLHGESSYELAFHDFYIEFESRHYISGEIHKSLMELQQLKYLNLSLNNFPDNNIPEFLGSLRNMIYLDLSSCGFRGKIPTQFGSLSRLKYLNLADNYLEGSIPPQLGNLSNLQYLDLSYNNIEGNIPSQLGNLSNLQELYLRYEGDLKLGDEGALKLEDGNQWLSNLISVTHLYLGYISNFNSSHSWLQMIAKLPKLRALSLVHCGLSDPFILSLSPSKFNSSASLSILDLSSNTFTSSMIFQWVSNITSNLVELDLSSNHLEGSTSNHIGMALNSLEHLDLSFNRLKGDLKSFMNICTLHSLYMHENNLKEVLPPILHNLSSACARYSLQELDLSFSKITGSLCDFSMFSSLKRLDLSGNQLRGKIPEGILPSQLESLSIPFNSLEGGIPISFGNACALGSLDLSDNNFNVELAVIIQHLSGCARYSLRELNLEGNQIHGTLSNLSILSNLKTLHLSENQLNGKIPEGILPSHLETLSIGSNTLEGGIPKSFGNACALRSLDLSNNSLSDEFLMIIQNLSGCARYSLENLFLGMNQINGILPDLSIFPSLKELYLGENKLNGDIPEGFQFPPQLKALDMQSNSLKGVFSDYHFVNMSKLHSLELSDNSLALPFSQNWMPPFQLHTIGLRSCKLGPAFPKWLQTQNEFDDIDISNATISDIVPEWFWAKLTLRDWIAMNISNNKLQGIIPNFPQKNPYRSLTLGSNQFEGPIPPFLRGSIYLDLSKNRFSDSRPFLCAGGIADTLYILDLSNNQLSGQIPDCWSHFKSLAFLDLSHNKFSEKIPTSVGSLLDLRALLLRNNNLTDEIPLTLKSCTKLVMLDMAENRLLGPIPSWIGIQMQELEFLSLGSNHLYGSFPLQTCYLRNIHLLDLSLNNLSGKIPSCIKNFTLMAQKAPLLEYHLYFVNTDVEYGYASYDLNAFLMWKGKEQMFKNNRLSLLKNIDLSSNHFSEEIPTEIEYLLGLVSLNLSRNNLNGKIPSNIGKLTSLEFIDLSRNQLVGSIPRSLTQIDRLAMLDLSHNQLIGQIPTGTQLQSFNASSYEDNLNLCGPPLEKSCVDEKPPQEANDEDEYSLLGRDFYMSMALGFVLSFWVVFGSILFKRSWRHSYFMFLNNLWERIYVTVVIKNGCWLEAS